MFLRIGCLTVVTVLIAFAWLAQPAYDRVTETRRLALDTRAKLVAEDLAKDVSRARDAGVALVALRGVEDVINAQIRGREDLVGVQIVEAGGTRVSVPSKFDTVGVRRATADVRARGNPVGQVEVYYRDRTSQSVLIEIGALMLGLCLVGVLPALIALRQAIRLGPERREAVLSMAYEAVANGRFNKIFTAGDSKDHDMRLVWLTRHVRALHESVMRLERLVASLIATEPAPSRRESLFALRRRARASNSYATSSLTTEMIPHESLRMSWALFLAPAGLAAMQFPLSRIPAMDFTVLFAAIAFGLLASRVLFDPSIREFGCSLFAAAIGLTAAMLPDHHYLSSAFAGVSIGFITAVLLDGENFSLWVCGVAFGLGVGYVFQPLGSDLPRFAGLAILVLAFLVRGLPSTGAVHSGRGAPRLSIATAFGGAVFAALLSVPALDTGVFSGALFGMTGALGIACGVWLPRYRRLTLVALIVACGLAIAIYSGLLEPVLLFVPVALLALAAGKAIRQLVLDAQDAVSFGGGAAIGAALLWQLGYPIPVVLVLVAVVLAGLHILKSAPR